jgi:hypothetical protein
MATASQTISSVTAPSPACVAELHATTPRMPFTPAMAVPVLTGMPMLRACSGKGPVASGRASTMQGTSSPAA